MERWRLTTTTLFEPRDSSKKHASPVFIGKGSYGSVELYPSSTREDKDVALKTFFGSQKEGLDYTVLRELSVYGYLAAIGGHPSFPFVNQVVWGDDHTISLPMVYCGKGMSTRALGEMHPFDKDTLIGQLIDATYFLQHSMGIMQRDIKAANLVWNQDRTQLSLVDWGISRWFDDRHPYSVMTPLVQTLPYRAPELLLGQTRYTSKAEVWSLGILILEIWTGTISVSSKGEIEQLLHYFRLFGTPDETSWPSISTLPHYSPSFPTWPVPTWSKDSETVWKGLNNNQHAFLKGLLVMDPAQRWSMAQVRQEWYRCFPSVSSLPDYPSCHQREETMALDIFESLKDGVDMSDYKPTRQRLWSAFSEMEAKCGDSHGSLAYAMSLVDRVFLDTQSSCKRDIPWHMVTLAAVWVVSKLGVSTTLEDIDDCMKRVDKIGSFTSFGPWPSSGVLAHEKHLLTCLGFCVPDLSPHRFFRTLVEDRDKSLDFYNTGMYLLDLWEASPDFFSVSPPAAATQVFDCLEHKSSSDTPVSRFLKQALANPMAYKDVSIRLRPLSTFFQHEC